MFNILVSPDGSTLEYLHVDGLESLGEQHIRRASEVEFDDGHDDETLVDRLTGEVIGATALLVREPAWIATLMDGTEIARHPLRSEVLRMERAVIEDMLVRGEPILALV